MKPPEYVSPPPCLPSAPPPPIIDQRWGRACEIVLAPFERKLEDLDNQHRQDKAELEKEREAALAALVKRAEILLVQLEKPEEKETETGWRWFNWFSWS